MSSSTGAVPTPTPAPTAARGPAPAPTPSPTAFRPPSRPLGYLDERGETPLALTIRRRRRRWPAVFVLALSGLMIWAGAPAVRSLPGGGSPHLFGGPEPTPAWSGTAAPGQEGVEEKGAPLLHFPLPGTGEHRSRLLPAVTPADPSPAWRPARTQKDADAGDRATPVTFDPCRPVVYVLNPKGAPRGADAILRRVMAEVQKDTGLQIVREGTTTEPVDPGRDMYQPLRYGHRWAPVLVGWGDPRTFTDARTGRHGRTRTVSITTQGHPAVDVGGVLELDAPTVRRYLARPGGKAQAAAVIRYQVAQFVGLGDVDDAGQLMGGKQRQKTFAAGDLTGLAELGKGPCAPWL